jgi:methionyl-tRNA formyltransferase
MSQSLRVIFAGTPAFAAAHLKQLIKSSHEVVAVYTQPDRPAGRGKRLTPSPVKQIALDHELPLLQPPTLRNEGSASSLAAFGADVMVVVAYGLLLPKAILETPRLGCINVHASLLPRWRGAAPIHRAIEAGDVTTGVTIMAMDEGLDTGPMLSRATIDISEEHTTESLTQALQTLGGNALITTLDDLESSLKGATKQPDDGVTYAHKIRKEEAAINWDLSAAEISRKVRALSPAPGCFGIYKKERIKIWEARAESTPSDTGNLPGTLLALTKNGLEVACGEGDLVITRLQLPNKKPMSLPDIMNGHKDRLVVGDRFESNEE